MRIPRVPTLQHFVRFVSRDPAKIAHKLREMAERPPRISYQPAMKGGRDHLILGVPQSDVLAGIERIKGDMQRKVNREAALAFFQLDDVFHDRRFVDLDFRYFAIGRKLHVPVNPFLYSSWRDGSSVIWPSFWSHLNLTEEQLATFGTIMDLTYFSSPDFSESRLEFADLGRAPGESERGLHMIGRGDLPTMSADELKQLTDAFAEAYHTVLAEARAPSAPGAKARSVGTGAVFLDHPAPP